MVFARLALVALRRCCKCHSRKSRFGGLQYPHWISVRSGQKLCVFLFVKDKGPAKNLRRRVERPSQTLASPTCRAYLNAIASQNLGVTDLADGQSQCPEQWCLGRYTTIPWHLGAFHTFPIRRFHLVGP